VDWDPDFDVSTATEMARTLVGTAADALGAGPVHRRRLGAVDLRIVVSGTRGKSTTTEWLHDVFHRRGYDTFAKVTGNRPVTMYNGTVEDIERSGQVRLYENERVFGEFADRDVDVAVFENQGIREYTTRLVSEQFIRPHVVVLTNVREDHLDTMGQNRAQIARSLARAVPDGTTVINGERDPQLREYVGAELERRDASVRHVDVPSEKASVPGAELVYAIDSLLETVDEEPLSPADKGRKLADLSVEWTELPGGQVFDASEVNDVQSTEVVRRWLLDDHGTAIEPLVFLRGDRPGRTASFVRYIDRLADRGVVEQVHLMGTDRHRFALNTSVSAIEHDTPQKPPSDVLDEALEAGRPVAVMGNTVDDYMRDLETEITERAREAAEPTVDESVAGRETTDVDRDREGARTR